MQFSVPHQIQTIVGRGRCCILSKYLESGNIAICEEAYALVSLHHFSCAYCCRTIRNAETNSVTMYETAKDDPNKYCSQECLTQDFPVHKHEIEALKIISSVYSKGEGSALSQYVDLDRLRLLTRISAKSKYETEMCGKSKENCPVDLTTEGTTSSCIRDILSLQGPLLSESEAAEVKKLITKLAKIGSLCKLPLLANAKEVIHILSVFRCNAHHVVDSDNGAVIALGLFPLVSMLNHSCQPNCVKHFDFCENFDHVNTSSGGGKRPPRLVIRPMRTILDGEELVYSYVPLYQSTEARKAQLQHSYGFSCTCSRCEKWGAATGTQAGLNETYLDVEERANLSTARRSRLQAAKDSLQSLLNEYARVSLLRGDDATDLRRQLLDRYVLYLEGDLNSLSGAIFPQHKLLLQFYVCMLNLSVSVYQISEGKEEEPRSAIKALRYAISLGLLAIGCLYTFIHHHDHADKETADIEASVAVACELLLTKDLPLPLPPPPDTETTLLKQMAVCSEGCITFIHSMLFLIDHSSEGEETSFLQRNKESVVSLWQAALSKCAIPAGHGERAVYDIIRPHFAAAAQEHMRICRGKVKDGT